MTHDGWCLCLLFSWIVSVSAMLCKRYALCLQSFGNPGKGNMLLNLGLTTLSTVFVTSEDSSSSRPREP